MTPNEYDKMVKWMRNQGLAKATQEAGRGLQDLLNQAIEAEKSPTIDHERQEELHERHKKMDEIITEYTEKKKEEDRYQKSIENIRAELAKKEAEYNSWDAKQREESNYELERKELQAKLDDLNKQYESYNQEVKATWEPKFQEAYKELDVLVTDLGNGNNIPNKDNQDIPSGGLSGGSPDGPDDEKQKMADLAKSGNFNRPVGEEELKFKENIKSGTDLEQDIKKQANKVQNYYKSELNEGLGQDESARAITNAWQKANPYVTSVLHMTVNNCVNVIAAASAQETRNEMFQSDETKNMYTQLSQTTTNNFSDGSITCSYTVGRDNDNERVISQTSSVITEDELLEEYRAATKNQDITMDVLREKIKDNSWEKEALDNSDKIATVAVNNSPTALAFANDYASNVKTYNKEINYDKEQIMKKYGSDPEMLDQKKKESEDRWERERVNNTAVYNLNVEQGGEAEAIISIATQGIDAEKLKDARVGEVFASSLGSIERQLEYDAKLVKENGDGTYRAFDDFEMLTRDKTSKYEDQFKAINEFQAQQQNIQNGKMGSVVLNGKDVTGKNTGLLDNTKNISQRGFNTLKGNLTSGHATEYDGIDSSAKKTMHGAKIMIFGMSYSHANGIIKRYGRIHKNLILSKGLTEKHLEWANNIWGAGSFKNLDELRNFLANSKSGYEVFLTHNHNRAEILKFLKGQGVKVSGLELKVTNFFGTKFGRIFDFRQITRNLVLSQKARLGIFLNDQPIFKGAQRLVKSISNGTFGSRTFAFGIGGNPINVGVKRKIGRAFIRGKGLPVLNPFMLGSKLFKGIAAAMKAARAVIDKITNSIPYYNVIKLVVKIVVAVCVIFFACFCTGGLTYNQSASVNAFEISIAGLPVNGKGKDADGNMSLAKDMLVNMDYLLTRNMDNFVQNGLKHLIAPDEIKDDGTIEYKDNGYTLKSTTYCGVSYPSGTLSLISKDPTSNSARLKYIYNPKNRTVTSGYYKDYKELNLSGLDGDISGETDFFKEKKNRIGTYVYNSHPRSEHSIYYISIDGTLQYKMTNYSYNASGNWINRLEVKVNENSDDDDGDNTFFASTDSDIGDIGVDNLTYFENNREIIAMATTMLQNDFAISDGKDSEDESEKTDKYSSAVDFAIYAYNLWMNSHYCDFTDEFAGKTTKEVADTHFNDIIKQLFTGKSGKTVLEQYNAVTDLYKDAVTQNAIFLSRMGVVSDTDNGDARNLMVPLDKNAATVDVAHYLTTPLSLVPVNLPQSFSCSKSTQVQPSGNATIGSKGSYAYTFEDQYALQNGATGISTTSITNSLGVAGLNSGLEPYIKPAANQNTCAGEPDWAGYAEGTNGYTGGSTKYTEGGKVLKVVSKYHDGKDNIGIREGQFVAGEFYDDYDQMTRNQSPAAYAGQSYDSYDDALDDLTKSIETMYKSFADTFGLTVGDLSDDKSSISISFSASSIYCTSCDNPAQISMTEANSLLGEIVAETEEIVTKGETDTRYFQYTIKDASVPNRYAIKRHENYVEIKNGDGATDARNGDIWDCTSGVDDFGTLSTITGVESLNTEDVIEKTIDESAIGTVDYEYDATSSTIHKDKTKTPNNTPVTISTVESGISSSFETTDSTYSGGKYCKIGTDGDGNTYYAKYELVEKVVSTSPTIPASHFGGTKALTQTVELDELKPTSYIKLKKVTKPITVSVNVTAKIKYYEKKDDTATKTGTVDVKKHNGSYFAGWCYETTHTDTSGPMSITKDVDTYEVETSSLSEVQAAGFEEPKSYIQQYSIGQFQAQVNPTGEFIIDGSGISASMVSMYIPCGGHTNLCVEPVILTFNGSITMFDVDGAAETNVGLVSMVSTGEDSCLRDSFARRKLDNLWSKIHGSNEEFSGTAYTDMFGNEVPTEATTEATTEESTEEGTTEEAGDTDGDGSAAGDEKAQLGNWDYETSEGEEYRLEATSIVDTNWKSQYNIDWTDVAKLSNERAKNAGFLVDSITFESFEDMEDKSEEERKAAAQKRAELREAQLESEYYPRYTVVSQLEHSEYNEPELTMDALLDSETGNILYGVNDYIGPAIAEIVTAYSDTAWSYQPAVKNPDFATTGDSSGGSLIPGYYYKTADSSKAKYDLNSLLYDDADETGKSKMSNEMIKWKSEADKEYALDRIERLRRAYQFIGTVGYSRSARYFFCSTGNPIGMNWKESDVGLMYKTDDVGFAMYVIGDDPRYATNDEMQKITPEVIGKKEANGQLFTLIGLDANKKDEEEDSDEEEPKDEEDVDTATDGDADGPINHEEEFNEKLKRTETNVTARLYNFSGNQDKIRPGDIVYDAEDDTYKVSIYLYTSNNTHYVLTCQPFAGYGSLGPGGVSIKEFSDAKWSDAKFISIDKDAVDDTQYHDVSYWLVKEDVDWSHWTIGGGSKKKFTVGAGVDGMMNLAEAIADADSESDMDGAPFHYIWGGGHDNGDGPYGATMGVCKGDPSQGTPPCSETHYGYDCSGFVYNMTKAAGLYDGGSFLANDAHKILPGYGWEDLTTEFQKGEVTPQRGDIWESENHIIFIGDNGNKVHAQGHNTVYCPDSIIIEPYNLVDLKDKCTGYLRYTGN